MGVDDGEQAKKLFLGGLNYNTDEDGLQKYFSQYGELVDYVVMRFPDTKRSRGFGFVTFADASSAAECYNARPHTIDDTQIETKKATPRSEGGRGRGGGDDEGATNTEVHRKLFIGGLDYSITDEQLREHFEKFGELADCIVMKFRDTKRSRGFGFVTYTDESSVDEVQKNRPHRINGNKVETKRATPREDVGKAGVATGSREQQNCTKLFIGSLKDNITDEDISEYFGQFGAMTKCEQMTEKGTGKKRGFGFVEFEDYDSVDKILLIPRHQINGMRIEVQRAMSRQEINSIGGPPGSRQQKEYAMRMQQGGGGGPAPWGGDGGYGGGYGGGMGGGGGYGGGNMGGGFNSGFSQGGGNWGGSNPWQGGNQGGAWENQGGGSGWGNDGGNQGGAWGGNQGGGFGGGYGGNQQAAGGGGWGGNQGGGFGGGQGGPMRNSGMGGGQRNAPYNAGGRGGGMGGGMGGRGGGMGGGRRGGGMGGGGGRW